MARPSSAIRPASRSAERSTSMRSRESGNALDIGQTSQVRKLALLPTDLVGRIRTRPDTPMQDQRQPGPAVESSTLYPSVAHAPEPWQSVRKVATPAAASAASVSCRGWPNRLRTPEQMTAALAPTAARKAGDDDVRLPWWPTLRKSA